MRKIVRLVVLTLAWLLASPTLHVPDRTWLEVGVPPAAADLAAERPGLPEQQ
jgi:hypothetical protein